MLLRLRAGRFDGLLDIAQPPAEQIKILVAHVWRIDERLEILADGLRLGERDGDLLVVGERERVCYPCLK